MIGFLASRFIKDYQNTSDAAVRRAYGVLCGAVGIAINLLLFALKLFAGTLAGSVAITADAFNNLSDAGASIVTLLGFRLAGQKPDPEHPFGHGRLEYISGLIVSIVILLMGFELLRDAVGAILHPEAVECSVLTVAILLISICAKFYMTLGVRREHIYMFDSKGLIHTGRIDLHATKAQFSQSEDCSLEEALTGADVFLGLSTKGLLTQDMVKLMAPSPIIFACANPDPEITYQDAKKARPDCIMGSGRSDWPNQVNNVSCFPFIFRAALDVRASVINEQMKIAAARSLADLAKEPVPQEVIDLYGGAPLSFGIDYVIPKPIDPRIIEWECPAVAQAAMISGVAQSPIRDMEAYTLELRKRIAAARERVSGVVRSYL